MTTKFDQADTAKALLMFLNPKDGRRRWRVIGASFDDYLFAFRFLCVHGNSRVAQILIPMTRDLLNDPSCLEYVLMKLAEKQQQRLKDWKEAIGPAPVLVGELAPEMRAPDGRLKH